MTQPIEEVVQGRHPSTQHAARLFAYKHLPVSLQYVSKVFHDTAVNMIQMCCDGPELSTGLRKLREAKDCAVVQKVIDDDIALG